MRKTLDELKRDEKYYQSQIEFLEKCIDDSLREIEEYKRQLKFHVDDLKNTQEDLEFIEGALTAGIPLSVILGKTKLTDHFSQDYIDMQCNRTKVDQDETD